MPDKVPMAAMVVLVLAVAAPGVLAADDAPQSAPMSAPALTSAPATTTTSTAPAAVPKLCLIEPVGFGIVVAWVLSCLYCVSWAQLRSLVPVGQKGVLNIALLVTGPIGLGAILIVRRNPKLRGKFEDLLGRFIERAPLSSAGPTEAVPIELCNSDGTTVSTVRGKDTPGNETVELAKRIIYEALERRSSDILIDPRSGNTYLIRYRIDGLLHDVTRVPADQGAAIVNCLKVASRLDISEKRRPQDGAFLAKLNTRDVKFRTATAGTLYGEKIAVRIFDVQTGLMTLDNLGLNAAETRIVERFMGRSDGMMAIAGPTGSGKTTTLYSALNLLVGQGRNIVTIEDPIEYPVEHASQTEVNLKANITFATGLRSILRQDPDVILVGEIRDAETADIALQASQTGHLVLSTIHSNDGPTALARLMDFGIEPFLITTGLSMVVSQRLVRVLCPNCKSGAKVSAKLRREAARRQIALGKVSVAVGCDVCDGTGYMGRTGVFEALPLSREMGHLLMKKPSLATIQARAKAEKVVTMRQRGMERVLLGQTSVEEVLRVTT